MPRAYEYGCLYKPISGSPYEYGNSATLLKDQSQKTVLTKSNYNSGTASPSTFVSNIDWKYGFKPISFIENKNIVIGEVFALETKTISLMTPNSSSSYGISFGQDTINESRTRMFRVEIEVNDFIRNFEKIL